MDIVTVGDLAANAARIVSRGNEIVEVAAGQLLKIETSPNGSDVLNRTCPQGKVRRYTITVTEEEWDA